MHGLHDSQRPWRLAWAIVLATARAPAWATPLDDPHVGGVGFSGPTTGDLAAVHWNPAALALLEGRNFRLATTFRLDSTQVARSSIDPATGRGPGARLFPEVDGSGNVQPLSWPLGPGTFIGFAINLGGRFTLALAGYSPSFQRVRYRATAGGEQPTRYHAVEVDLRNYALVPALAFRVARRLRVGAAPGFLFPTGAMVFDQDSTLAGGQAGLQSPCLGSACGAENPAAAARYDLRGDFGPFRTAPEFTLSAGLLYEFDTWTIAGAYASRPLGRGDQGVEVEVDASAITLPATLGGGSICQGQPAGATGPTDCVDGRLGYHLPHTFTAGVEWRLRRAWTLLATGRYLTFSSHDNLRIRVTGPAGSPLGSAAVPDRLILHRGFRNVLELRGSVVHEPIEGVRLAAGLRGSTGAVKPDHLGPGAVDGPTIEPSLAASIQWRWLSLSAGYAIALMLPHTVGPDASVFDPTAAVACADSGRDLGNPACQTDLEGAARPTAAGRYARVTQAFSVTAAAQF